MMDRVDRIQLAVTDVAAAIKSFKTIFDAEVLREDKSKYLGAHRTILAFGESEVELCAADGSGRTADFVASRKGHGGLMTAGLSCNEPERLKAHIEALGFECTQDGDQFYMAPEDHFGMSFVISKTYPRRRVGLASFLYEVTNTLVTDWRFAAAHFAGLFQLEARNFTAIGSAGFGYEGTLTLFNKPNQLDRIELSQVVNQDTAMGRWVGRQGDSLYMCYCQTHDIQTLAERFREAGVRWTPKGGDPATESDGMWTDPRDMHGLLMGVSRDTLGWDWSGHPEAVDPPRKAAFDDGQ
jgi:hypothetical protein